MHIHRLLAEFSEEIGFLERIILEAETEIETNKKLTPSQITELNAKRYGWLVSYKNTIQQLVDTCLKIQNDIKKQTNIRYLRVYKMERAALVQLRKLYMETKGE